MSFQTKIPCPECQSEIVVDSALLLGGAEFSCTNGDCTTSISIDVGSIEKAKEAFEEFESLRRNSVAQAKSA